MSIQVPPAPVGAYPPVGKGDPLRPFEKAPRRHIRTREASPDSFWSMNIDREGPEKGVVSSPLWDLFWACASALRLPQLVAWLSARLPGSE
jgi:hypothetical protein